MGVDKGDWFGQGKSEDQRQGSLSVTGKSGLFVHCVCVCVMSWLIDGQWPRQVVVCTA
jgi:hypothetical protein